MSNQKAVSITFRPRELNSGQINNFKKWLISMGGTPSENSKIMSLEGEGQNHIQSGILTEKRTDNIRRSLIKILDWENLDDDEKKHSLKIKSHNNWNFLIGYCIKEENIFYTNITEEHMKICKKYYQEQNNKLTQIKHEQKWMCSGINSLLETVYTYCINEGINPLKRRLRELVVEMTAYGLLPFSLARKIKQSDEIFWKALCNVKLAGEANLDEIITYYDDDDNLTIERICKFCRRI